MGPESDGEVLSPEIDGQAVCLEDTYRSHATFLREIAHRKFRIPPGDAEALVNDVFMSFLLRRDVVRNPRKWLIGAVCHASRGYWRTEAKSRPLPPDIDDYADPESPNEKSLVDRVTIAATLNRLCRRCRNTLHLYYAEGYTAAEIAEQFDTTSGYVMQLLHTCRKQAREIYNKLKQEPK
ncbi:MAG TPA: sigma-70 family RNA polymerase sigma factor [Thermoanaerobaculia bacterium]|jgi:RNA polymerase sigma factor (sigma-70 family)